MAMIYLLSAALLSAGIFLLLTHMLHLPTFATTHAAISVSRQSTAGSVKKWDETVLAISSKVARIVKLDGYKLQSLTKTLKAAEISIPPQTWLARCYVRFALALLAIIPATLIWPVLAPVVAILAVQQLFTDLRSAERAVADKRHSIERDLPRFTATIAQELKNTRNVLAILEGYLASAQPAFHKELVITIGDMKSGSQETALSRLDARVGSSMLSEVVLGLLAVLHGDDESNYFDLLAHDFDQQEIQDMRLKIAKLPDKVGVCIAAVFVCVMLLISVILGMQLWQSSSMFR